MLIGMIPARIGSQRLKRKNLRKIGGVPLITHAIRKTLAAGCFDEVWVNADDPVFEKIAAEEGVPFHRRPPPLANDEATSEEYVEEFLERHPCECLFQIHSIAPLLTVEEIRAFAATMKEGRYDVLLSVVEEQIECLFRGVPVNFSREAKTNSQELTPVERVTWSITGWRAATYLAARREGRCATYAGRVGTVPISRMAGHIIKREEDLRIADLFWRAREAG